MKKRQRIQRMKWAKRIVFGAIALAATFGAGYLAAGEKPAPGTPSARLLIPEGQKVVAAYEDKDGLFVIRTEDAQAVTHIYWYLLTYKGGEVQILRHVVVGTAPGTGAFKN